MPFVSMRAAPPSRRHLNHWEAVCRYLDAQPYRAVTYPFPSEPPMSARLFKRMARYGLVRHRDDCRWRLSLRWRAILHRLYAGLPPSDVSSSSASTRPADSPFVTDFGVDTLYANLLCGAGLPAELIAACDALKAKAQADDTTVETPWLVLGAPLSMYKAGVGTRQKGRGVSWSYILRNAQVMLLLRKAPIACLVGSVRLSAECLWTRGARAALDGLRDDLRRLWASVEPGSFEGVRWQLSQIHLCADVANFAPQPADLERVLTRSLRQAVHFPSTADVDGAFAWPDTADGEEDGFFAEMPDEWEGIPLDALTAFDALARMDMALPMDRSETEDAEAEDNGDARWADERDADEDGAAVHLWGRRASGFAFSPGGDLSAAWYDKLLEERRSGKRWMEAIHTAGGWAEGMALWRVEARFRRGALRALRPYALRSDEDTAPWFDDPWRALDHLPDLWAYFAGASPEADTAPDVTYRGWMRLCRPHAESDDENRARWPTDPTWETIQRAPAIATMQLLGARPLVRAPATAHDLERVDAELYGLFKLRTALRGEYLETAATLSLELRDFAGCMDEVDAERGRDYAEEVREKARQMGKPVPIRDRKNPKRMDASVA